MNNNQTLVKIVIPIYKNELNTYELQSLCQCSTILSDYPMTFVKPFSLDLPGLLRLFPQMSVENFDDSYFETIYSYNRLMLSYEFYERFENCQYILIHQLDAYVFRDELQEWCNKNYDYIGAPWLPATKYSRSPYLLLQLKALFHQLVHGRPFRPAVTRNKIGNGGFSLRKIHSHLQVTMTKKKKIRCFLEHNQQYSEFNEDVFWATQNPEFTYPTWREALAFAFEDYPETCFGFNHNQLPFGCHAWYKPDNWNFWKNKINLHNHENRI